MFSNDLVVHRKLKENLEQELANSQKEAKRFQTECETLRKRVEEEAAKGSSINPPSLCRSVALSYFKHFHSKKKKKKQERNLTSHLFFDTRLVELTPPSALLPTPAALAQKALVDDQEAETKRAQTVVEKLTTELQLLKSAKDVISRQWEQAVRLWGRWGEGEGPDRDHTQSRTCAAIFSAFSPCRPDHLNTHTKRKHAGDGDEEARRRHQIRQGGVE